MDGASLLDDLGLDPNHSGSTAVIISEDGEVEGFQIGTKSEREFPDFIDSEDFPFYMTTVLYVFECIKQWSKYKADGEKDTAKSSYYRNLSYMLENSQLLGRLIEGKSIFAETPPRNFNNNWYEVLEYGEDIVLEAEFSKYSNAVGMKTPIGGEEYAILNKFPWDIVETVKQGEEYVVTYDGTESNYRLTKATDEDQTRLLHPREERNANTNAWILIREEDDGGDTGA